MIVNDSVVSSRERKTLSEANALLPTEPSAPEPSPRARETSMAAEEVNRVQARLLSALAELSSELTDLAFDLNRRPQFDAADLACIIARRLENIAAEAFLSASSTV